MAIDFPNSPTLNQIYTVGSRSWIWDGSTWNIYANVPNRYIQDAAPSSPQSGDQWFESDTGRLFVYYDSAWVEIGNATDIAGALQPGQVTALTAVTSLTTDDVFPVIDNPSSATAASKITYGNLVTAMSSSLAPGLVLITSKTATSGSTMSIDNCFTSTYTRYRIVGTAVGSTSTAYDIPIRFRASSSDTATGYYAGVTRVDIAAGTSSVVSQNNATYGFIGCITANGGRAHFSMDVVNPQTAQYTSWSSQATDSRAASGYGGISAAGQLANTTQYDGITFSIGGWGTGTFGNITVHVYGYRD